MTRPRWLQRNGPRHAAPKTDSRRGVTRRYRWRCCSRSCPFLLRPGPNALTPSSVTAAVRCCHRPDAGAPHLLPAHQHVAESAHEHPRVRGDCDRRGHDRRGLVVDHVALALEHDACRSADANADGAIGAPRDAGSGDGHVERHVEEIQAMRDKGGAGPRRRSWRAEAAMFWRCSSWELQTTTLPLRTVEHAAVGPHPIADMQAVELAIVEARVDRDRKPPPPGRRGSSSRRPAAAPGCCRSSRLRRHRAPSRQRGPRHGRSHCPARRR